MLRFLPLILLSLVSVASAADLVFVLGGSGPGAVYDSGSLARVGPADVPAGTSEVFRAFQAAGTRYYAVGPQGVAVLDAERQRVATIPLDLPAGAVVRAAFAEPLERLAVAAGRSAYLIDTAADEVAATLELEFEALGLAIPPGSGRALALGADARSIWEIDLETGEVSGPTSALPAAADALAVSANGGRAAAVSGRGLFELRASGVGGSGAAGGAGRLGSVLAIDDQGGAVWRVGDELRVLRPESPVAAALTDPRTGLPLGPDVVDVAMTGGAVLALTADGRLVRFGEDGAAEVVLEAPGTALALAGGPEKEQGTPAISAIAGNGQAVAAGADFAIVVKSNFGSQLDLKITATNGADCPVEVPLAAAATVTVTCTAPEVTAVTAVTVTAQAFAGPTPLNPELNFSITVFPTGQDGLTAASPTSVTIGPGADVDLVVQATQMGAPQNGVAVTVTDNSDLLDCESSETTGTDGRATIDCSADATIPSQTTVTVSVSGLGDTVDFMVTITATGAQVEELIRTTPSLVNVVEGGSVNLGIRTLLAGAARPNIVVNVAVSSGVLVCANTVTTGADGRTTITCQSSSVATNQSVTVTASEGGRSVQFTVNVLDSAQADGITKVSGDNQLVGSSSAFPNNMVVSATVAGTPQPNLRLTILPDSTSVFCDAQIFTDLNGLGTFQCNAGPVSGLTNVTIQVRDDANRQLQQPFQATIVPGAVGQADDVILLSPAQVTLPANTPVPNAVRVRALDGGLPAAGAAIFFSSNQNVTFAPAVGTTNLNGETTTTVTIPCSPSSGSIRVSVSQSQATTDKTVNYTRTSGGFSQIQKLNGDNQTASAGQTFAQALRIRTADSCGAGVGNQPVTWQVIPAGAGTLVNISGGVTNQSGEASTQVRAGAIGGPFTVRATSGAQTVDFQLTVNNNPTVFQAISGGGQSIPRGVSSQEPLVVRVLNDAGDPVPNVPVTFRVVTGAATLNPFTAQTDAAGRAQTFVTAGAVRGQVVIEAGAISQTVRFTVFVVGDQPVADVAGMTNGASFRTGLTPGSAGTIFGTGITGDVNVIAEAPFPFPTEFRGIQVLINNVPSPIFHLIRHGDGSEQINFQVPFTIAGATSATVTIINNGAQASIPNVPIFSIQPGVFQYFPAGSAQAHAAALDQNFAVIGPDNPVPSGGVVQLFVTGLGATSPPVATNTPGPSDPLPTVNASVTVGLNDQGVPILGAFYAPGLVSVYQINLLIPEGLPPGLYRLSVVVDGIGSQTVLLAVGAPPPVAAP